MDKDFLGRGWNFPFGIDAATGEIAFSAYEENIRQCIGIIIGTRQGERQMLPQFGCRIHDLLFAPSNQYTAQQASKHVKEALEIWENRIQVLEVQSSFDPSGAIRVELSYRISSTGAVEHLSQVISSQ